MKIKKFCLVWSNTINNPKAFSAALKWISSKLQMEEVSFFKTLDPLYQSRHKFTKCVTCTFINLLATSSSYAETTFLNECRFYMAVVNLTTLKNTCFELYMYSYPITHRIYWGYKGYLINEYYVFGKNWMAITQFYIFEMWFT